MCLPPSLRAAIAPAVVAGAGRCLAHSAVGGDFLKGLSPSGAVRGCRVCVGFIFHLIEYLSWCRQRSLPLAPVHSGRGQDAGCKKVTCFRFFKFGRRAVPVTYVHGLFDTACRGGRWLDSPRANKGLGTSRTLPLLPKFMESPVYLGYICVLVKSALRTSPPRCIV